MKDYALQEVNFKGWLYDFLAIYSYLTSKISVFCKGLKSWNVIAASKRAALGLA